MQRLPRRAQISAKRRCTMGSVAMSVSIPRSPRATMTASAARVISSALRTPSVFSILAMTWITRPARGPSNSRSSAMSSADLTKDNAMKSISSAIPNAMSSRSLSVIDARLTAMPGRLTCLRLPSMPPSATWHSSRPLVQAVTRTLMRPLSSLTRSPTATASASPG